MDPTLAMYENNESPSNKPFIKKCTFNLLYRPI